MAVRQRHNSGYAPAKLNLFLHITGQRDDGYHNLQTAFQFLDHADIIDCEKRNDGEIHLITPFANIDPNDNLIVKAAYALKTTTDCNSGANIRIRKNIALGAGLGGGSSNAATTLVLLNRLWRTQLSEQQLQQLGAKLGADVPVFIGGRAAFAEGIGDTLYPHEFDEPWVVLLTPACQVATKVVFSHPNLPRTRAPIDFAAGLPGSLENDCSTIAQALFPVIKTALDWLAQFGPAYLTGTGACCFTNVARRAAADAIAQQSPFHCRVAKKMNRSLLYTACPLTSQA